MGKETIMLAKPVATKLIDPEAWYMISEKIDGQPANFSWNKNNELVAESRQGKPITSLNDHMMDCVHHYMTHNDLATCTGELDIPEMGSAEISGLVRKDEVCDDFQLRLFPHQPDPAQPTTCMQVLDAITVQGCEILDAIDSTGVIRLFNDDGSFNVETALGFQIMAELNMVNEPKRDKTDRNRIEGFIAYKIDEPWVAGKRSNGYIKLIQDPTIDLLVVDIEEAVSKDGEPLGRAGAFICKWGDGTCKVGAGKLSHQEAKEVWLFREVVKNERVIEAKYKADGKYTKPRQPTFQRFRHDKDTYQTSFEE